MNLLLIDDDKHVIGPLRNNIERHFERRGIRLLHCSSAKDGLQLAKNDSSIKFVLLDVMMPCMDGPLGTIPLIKKFPCSVAVYSAHTDEELIKAASECGAVAFISKYDRADEQLKRIDGVVRQIESATIRSKTESAMGLRLRPRSWDRKLAIVVTLIAIVSAVCGALAAATAFGASRQAEKDGYTADKKATSEKIDALEKTHSDKMKILESRLVIQEANAKTLRRMERNIDKLLQKNGIPPTRDDE